MADIFPTRTEVEWEHLAPGKIVIIVNKDLGYFEEKIANFLGAPKSVRRPLDVINSKLWILMDGKMSVNQIVSEMDLAFAEKIAPASERVNRAIAEFVHLGLVKLNPSRNEEE